MKVISFVSQESFLFSLKVNKSASKTRIVQIEYIRNTNGKHANFVFMNNVLTNHITIYYHKACLLFYLFFNENYSAESIYSNVTT